MSIATSSSTANRLRTALLLRRSRAPPPTTPPTSAASRLSRRRPREALAGASAISGTGATGAGASEPATGISADSAAACGTSTDASAKCLYMERDLLRFQAQMPLAVRSLCLSFNAFLLFLLFVHCVRPSMLPCWISSFLIPSLLPHPLLPFLPLPSLPRCLPSLPSLASPIPASPPRSLPSCLPPSLPPIPSLPSPPSNASFPR